MRKRRPGGSKVSAQRAEFNRQMELKEAKFPWDLEAFYVETYETDKHGLQVREAGLIESITAHTPEQVRNFGNRMKLIAANNRIFNVMIRVANRDDIPPRVYMRRPPPHITNRDELFKTTDERWRDKVHHDVTQAKRASQGEGDFDRKPDAEDFIAHILDEGEPELDEQEEV